MPMSRIRFGILGAGSVARRRVIPTMHDLECCKPSALMVRDIDRAEKIAAEFSIGRYYTSVDELLDDLDLDAVYISSPPNLHREHVLAAAERGKHVLCEKPMAATVEDCPSMIEACESAGVRLEVCFVLRGWKIYQKIKQSY